ncbi:hypothetical protein [Xanthomonas arboricola]|uniref:DUF4240 domain-containing protein n=1 Tax=Xanthomonas arboricola TaxID=56448 RepID=A0AB73H2E1_9XANT|nr:hypothetical protein [Xanthomonas arboricola]MBB5672316.1 hypothetical protein [Xanthomonas arboricola]
MSPSQRLEFWSLVADRIEASDPGALERGLERLQNWRDQANDVSASERYWFEWERRIRIGMPAVLQLLRDESEYGDVHRSTAPFTDVISQDERMQLLKSWRALR